MKKIFLQSIAVMAILAIGVIISLSIYKNQLQSAKMIEKEAELLEPKDAENRYVTGKSTSYKNSQWKVYIQLPFEVDYAIYDSDNLDVGFCLNRPKEWDEDKWGVWECQSQMLHEMSLRAQKVEDDTKISENFKDEYLCKKFKDPTCEKDLPAQVVSYGNNAYFRTEGYKKIWEDSPREFLWNNYTIKDGILYTISFYGTEEGKFEPVTSTIEYVLTNFKIK